MRILVCIFVIFMLSCSNPTSYDSKVPEGANIQVGRISQRTIPSGWTTIAPWMIAVHNSKLGSTSQVKVSFLGVYSVSSANDTLCLAKKDYSVDGFSPTTDGGMYTMYPSWFCDDNHTPMSGVSVESSALTFSPSSDKNHIWHWWTDRALLPSNSAYIVVKATVLLSGAACIQMGADWWKTYDAQWNGLNVNNTEVGTTNWYFSSSIWQTIVMSTK
jgi:hypothetical protein